MKIHQSQKLKALFGVSSRYSSNPRGSLGQVRQSAIEQERRENTWYLSALTIPVLALALYYGDETLQRALLFVGLIGVVHMVSWRFTTRKSEYYSGSLLLIINIIVLQVVLPRAVHGPVLLVPLLLTLAIAAPTLAFAMVKIGLVIGLRVLFLDVFDLGRDNSPIPALPFVVATLLQVMVVIGYSVRARHHTISQAGLSIAQAETELLSEQGALFARRAALARATTALEERQRQSAEQLLREREAVHKMRERQLIERDLTQAIHHDLREPLRSIVSFAQLLRREVARLPGGEASKVNPLLDHVADGGQRMALMLKELHTYANATEPAGVEDAHKHCLDQEVDLNVLLESLQLDLADLLQRSSATLSYAKLPSLYGHGTQLKQLFQNLLINAIKFTPKDRQPRVHIDASMLSDGQCAITVTDNGIGIPQARLAEVFGLFNRVHSADGYEGSGVGLALCRRIAIAHEFELQVTSEVGVGTVFTITVPRDHLCATASVGALPHAQEVAA